MTCQPKHEFLVTIIIPHKDDWERLARLLASLVGIDKHFQVVVVDDNSTSPPPPDFAQSIRLSIGSFQLVPLNVNQGAGAARNAGLNYAKGDWLLFADSDDIFTKDAIKIVKSAIFNIGQSTDIVYFPPEGRKDPPNQGQTIRHLPYQAMCSDYVKGDPRQEESLRYFHFVPWSKLIRRTLILEHRLKFDEVPASNDVIFSLQAGHLAKEIEVILKSIYCVTESGNSLTRNRNYAHFLSRLEVEIKRNRLLASMNKPHLISLTYTWLFKSMKYGLPCFIQTAMHLWKSDSKIVDSRVLQPSRWGKKIIRVIKVEKKYEVL